MRALKLRGTYIDRGPKNLVAQTNLAHGDGHAERRAVLEMIHCGSLGPTRRLPLNADKGYDRADFVTELRQACVIPTLPGKATNPSSTLRC